MVQVGVYFDTISPSENHRKNYLLHKNNYIVAKPLLGSLGKIRWCDLEHFRVNIDENKLKNLKNKINLIQFI